MKIEDIAKRYFENNTEINEDTLTAFLVENEWQLYDDYDKKCKRCDIKMELEEREIPYTEKQVEDVLYHYDDYLSDNDAWRDCLNEAIYTVFDE